MSHVQAVLYAAEVQNRPDIFRGLVSAWPAQKLWTGQAGLDRLINLAGAAPVQVMQNDKRDGLFFGDMKQYQPSTCSFADFLSSAQQPRQTEATCDNHQQHSGHEQPQAYLAQASLDSGQPLHALQQDLHVPEALQHTELSHTNLWMNFRTSRCSLHYDPYHNLLCVVQGQKTVKLMSPEATAFLYPHLVTGESPNHSQVNFASPDMQQHPLYEQALLLQQEFVLEAGDALFIPEGWWHQVDSEDMTIAVNFWWRSAFTKSLQPHMYAYYLRRIMDGLLDTERHKVLQSIAPHPQLQGQYQSLTGGGSEQQLAQAGATNFDGSTTSEGSLPSQSMSEGSSNWCSGATSCTSQSMSDTATSSGNAPQSDAAAAASSFRAQDMASANAIDIVDHMSERDDLKSGNALYGHSQSTHFGFVGSSKQANGHHIHPSSEVTGTMQVAQWHSSKRRACEAHIEAAVKTAEWSETAPSAQETRLSSESNPDTRTLNDGAVRDTYNSSSTEQNQLQCQPCLASSRSDAAEIHPLQSQDVTHDSKCKQHSASSSPKGDGESLIHQHPHKRVCRSASPDRQQPAGNKLHMTAMSLLAGAVSDKISQGQTEAATDLGLDDALTRILHSLLPADLQSVLLLMAKLVPRTLEGMLLYALTPAAAEVLTQKLEAVSADQGDLEQKLLYDALYGVVDDAQMILHSLLTLKEAFSWGVCRHTLSGILGIECGVNPV